MILALDIASCTGWAFGAPGTARPMFGERRLAPGGANEAIVFDNFDVWLTGLIKQLGPVYLYAEDVYLPRSEVIARRLYGLRAICAMVCHRHGIRYRPIPTGKLSRFFLGEGTRRRREDKKAATIRRCREYGWHPDTDNEADALAIWLYAEHDLEPAVTRTRTVGRLFA